MGPSGHRFGRVRGVDAGDVVALIVGIASAGVAVWAVLVAHRANRRSVEANEIAERSNGIAADANSIANEVLQLQRQTLPPEWSAAEKAGKYSVQFRNQSGRMIVVLAVEARPEIYEELVRLTEELPIQVDNGDVLRVSVMRGLGGGASSLRIIWRYFGDSDEVPIQISDRKV